jgi:hypothetical protein
VASALGLPDATSFLEEKGQKVQGGDVLMSAQESSEPQTAARESIPFSRILQYSCQYLSYISSLTHKRTCWHYKFCAIGDIVVTQ